MKLGMELGFLPGYRPQCVWLVIKNAEYSWTRMQGTSPRPGRFTATKIIFQRNFNSRFTPILNTNMKVNQIL